MKEKLMNLFFHELPMAGHEIELSVKDLNLLWWIVFIPLIFWLVRCVYKSFRKTTMAYQNAEVYLCRDLFLNLGGFEYLIVVVILVALYFGFWGYIINPSAANWLNWKTWVIVLPQLSLLLTIIVLFFIRYTNFRKPYIK